MTEQLIEELNNLKISTNTLYNGDCIEVMKENIDDKSVNLILCDLPYGITHNKWDKMIPFDDLWKEYKRILAPNGNIVLFGCGLFTPRMICSNEKMFRYTLVWEKNIFSDWFSCKKKPLRKHEDIVIFSNKYPTYNVQYEEGEPYQRTYTKKKSDNYRINSKKDFTKEIKNDGKRYPGTVLKFNRVHKPIHPTEKPQDLLRWLIRAYSNENDTVLDNCMGCGSAGIASKQENRNFIGIELDDNYFNIAKERINN